MAIFIFGAGFRKIFAAEADLGGGFVGTNADADDIADVGVGVCAGTDAGNVEVEMDSAGGAEAEGSAFDGVLTGDD